MGANLDFVGTNDLNLGSADFYVSASSYNKLDVQQNMLTIGGKLYGNLLVKMGNGTLYLTGDTSAAKVNHTGGIIRLGGSATLPGGDTFTMNDGAVLELTSNLTASIGTGAGKIGISTGGGGFGAYGGDYSINLGPSVTWDAGGFFGTATLFLSSATSTGTIDFTSDINLNSAGNHTRTINVNNGSAEVDGKISGVISSGAKLAKGGAGTLLLTASNTYTGATSVDAGKLIISPTGAINSTSNITVNTGATLQYENDSTGLSKPVILSGGVLVYNSSSAYTGGLLTVTNGSSLKGDGVLGAVTLNAGGTVAPGNSIGTLSTDNANFTWNGESSSGIGQMDFELSNSSASSDQLALGTGQLIKGTGNHFTFDFQNTGADGFTYTLMTFGSSSGFSVSDFAYMNLAGGFTGSFALNSGSLQFNVVPEPGTLGLVCLAGILGLTLSTRTRQRRH